MSEKEVKTMKKRRKESRNQDPTAKISLITAIIALIIEILNLIEKIID